MTVFITIMIYKDKITYRWSVVCINWKTRSYTIIRNVVKTVFPLEKIAHFPNIGCLFYSCLWYMRLIGTPTDKYCTPWDAILSSKPCGIFCIISFFL